jgi:Domain of unknown function (DUF4351)
MTDHDQNFKNLILDYPRESLLFFAQKEIPDDINEARIIPIREQQLKEQQGDHYRELDVPLLVEWADGRREALLFVLEEETQTRKFSIHRLAHYCLDLAELMETERVIPVVIFLNSGRDRPELLQLGSDKQTYLEFRYLSCYLKQLSAMDYCESDNIVIRLNLPNMCYPHNEKLEIYAAAHKGLATLESDINKQNKYADFIDIYAELSEEEQIQYRECYLNEEGEMMGLSQILRQEWREEGLQKGRQDESVTLIARMLRRKLGIHPELDQIVLNLKTMPVEKLEDLAEDLLDFSDMQDLTTWLQKHNKA